MRLTIVAGARPNFMKISPIIRAIQIAQKDGKDISYKLVHTGQHYDAKMSGNFFEELSIPHPDINLEVGSGSQAEQTAAIMTRFEKYLLDNKTDLVLVVGDVTSAMACAITAKKMNIKVAHVEAGLRSFDLTMPEEINRMVADSIADYYFTTSETANNNLKKAGADERRVFFVGNTMIDTLLANMERFTEPAEYKRLRLSEGGYFVLTLHRPANVDQEAKLSLLINAILKGARDLPIVFPIHPRTAKILRNLAFDSGNLHLIEPLGYLSFNYLVKRAKAVITDSGGITEETTIMGVPCMTLRDSTERPETCEIGTNKLIGTDPRNIAPAMDLLFSGKWAKGKIPRLWDGKTAERIVEHLLKMPV